MIIDFHTHILPPNIKKNRAKYADSDPCFAILYSKKEAKMITAEDLIASMNRDGVDVSVILNIGWTTHELCVETNDYILESIARYPGRLIGFCSVQPQSYDAALREIERCARAGAKGIGELRPDVQFFELSDQEVMQPFVQTLKKNNMTLLLHSSEPVGHEYSGKGTVTPETLYPFIIQFPDLNLVCAHWGGGMPFYALMPEVKLALDNVYFDTAATPFLYNPQIYQQVSDLVGADRILFGTDYPLLSQSRLINEVMSLDIPEENRNLIFSGNAMRLLGLEGA
jgi:predicted TIM-barrel fold metal-dependent hydrolase